MISREGAVEYFVYCLTELKMDTEAIREAHELAIEALSQPERPKGRWVCLEAEIGYYACSECDHRILRTKCNYCPNCGADMAELPNCGADMRGRKNETD